MKYCRSFFQLKVLIATVFLYSCGKTDGYAPAASIGNGGGTTVSGIFRSCAAILQSYPSATSGVYSVSHDGSGSVASTFNVYCDMTTNGGGWTLVMKQKYGDGATLQGDSSYFTSSSAGALNDINANLGASDDNLVSAGFTRISGSTLMLVAANESTVRTQSISNTTAFLAFASPTVYSDDINTTRPNWFINSSTYPNGVALTGARFGFNIAQSPTSSLSNVYCGVRWGWTANQDNSGVSIGTSDSCGGLGAYGTQYGGSFMSNKHVWQMAYLMLYIR